MALTRYSPFNAIELPSEFKLMQDTLSRFFDEPASARPWVPAVDVLETEHELILKADVPEVDMKDVDIQVENNTLTIKGQRKFEGETKGRGYHRIERSYGSFARTFSLPDTVDTENVKAEYKAGVLNISLPKKEVAKPRKVSVAVKE